MQHVETHLVISAAARRIIPHETDLSLSEVECLGDVIYSIEDIGAAIASGSFQTMGMIVIPCSIKTLSAIANSYAGNLITRAADVQLKERRPVVLMVRETPLHIGHLQLMSRAARNGCTIMPPVPAYYWRPSSLDDVVSHTVGRALALMGIRNTLYAEWTG
jgi:4-hydroxy-3-polyprenylbenzoate decarboxylase